MNPIISIIVPVYNCEQYIDRCINSILDQSFSDFELLLVDDGSKDKSGIICDKYAETDKRVIVLHQSNMGQAAARNNALKVARGEWIHYVDSDDVIHPQMLDLLYGAVTKSNAQMCFCRYCEDEVIPSSFLQDYTLSFNKLEISKSKMVEIYKDGQYYWTIWAKLIKKDIIESLPFTVGKVYEDNAVVPQWIYKSGIVAEVPIELYFYQINPKGTTKGKITEKYLDFLWAVGELLKFYRCISAKEMFGLTYDLFIASILDRYNRAPEIGNPRKIRRKVLRQGWVVLFRYSLYADGTFNFAKILFSKTFPGVYGFYSVILRREK